MLEIALATPAQRTAPLTFRLAVALSLAVSSLLCAAADSDLTTIVSFPDTNAPFSPLTQTIDGSLYGMTMYGGSSNRGTIFRISPGGAFTPLHSFTGRTTGSFPYAGLVQGRDGFLYGTAPRGGSGGFGTFFRISTNGDFTTLHSFLGATDGSTPYGPLVQAADGRFYGTTASSGPAGFGTVFRANTNGNVAVIHSFSGQRQGFTPYGGLIQARDGNFYGTTVQGGTNLTASFNRGTVFRLTPAGVLTTLHTFTGDDGSYPYGGLVQAADGFFYGMASGLAVDGTVENLGAIFRVGTNGTFTNLYAFTGGADGANPVSSLIQASDGALYGTTTGGDDTSGALFKITTGGAFSVLATFNGGNGAKPFGSVIQGADGNLYGTTTEQGVNGGGTAYRYNLNAPPFIIEQPEPLVVTNNNTAVFTVRAGGTGPLSYRWLKGSANVSDSENISGSTTSTLTIHSASGADAGQYSVIVNNLYGNTPSSAAALTVNVIRPNIDITSPKANARTSNDVVTVLGTSSGKLGVDAVYAQLNDGPWQLASTDNGWANWTADVAPEAGTNFVRAYSSDSEGRVSTTNTVRFFHVVAAPISVQVVGLGSVKPDYNGQELLVGRSYSMTARPARGFKFMGWSGSATAAKPKLSFLMAPDLSFTATFADVLRPQNKLLKPRKRQRFTAENVTLIGKSRDNAPGVAVYFQLNDTGWTTPETTNAFTNWSAEVILQPGTNTIRTYAVDASGLHSATSSVPVTYTPPE